MHSTFTSFDPVILFFILGAVATAVRANLPVPDARYHTLSIYLLLAIGITGGIELYHTDWRPLILPAVGTIGLGVLLPLLAYGLLLRSGKFDRENAIAIAMHYGSVSMVAYAVVTIFLQNQQIIYMAASASYIAAPAVARLTLPAANVTWYLTASLGITFPFNVLFGIPLYQQMAFYLYQ